MEIENRVIEKIKQRQEVGMQKYGMSVKDNPAGTLEWLNHLQEELLDASIYIEKLKDKISNLVEARVSPTEPTQEEIAGRIKENEYWLEMTEKTGKNWAMWHTYNFINRIKKLRGQ